MGQVLVPLMELPPLSPGIQARVIEEVDVVETVKRGWSGGTVQQDTHRLMGNLPFNIQQSSFFTFWPPCFCTSINFYLSWNKTLGSNPIYIPHSTFTVVWWIVVVKIENSAWEQKISSTSLIWSCEFARLTNRSLLTLKVTSELYALLLTFFLSKL